jgi:hypothetical protein
VEGNGGSWGHLLDSWALKVNDLRNGSFLVQIGYCYLMPFTIVAPLFEASYLVLQACNV